MNPTRSTCTHWMADPDYINDRGEGLTLLNTPSIYRPTGARVGSVGDALLAIALDPGYPVCREAV